MGNQKVLDMALKQPCIYMVNSLVEWQKLIKRYCIENVRPKHTLAVSLPDNGMALSLEYFIDYNLRRNMKK